MYTILSMFTWERYVLQMWSGKHEKHFMLRFTSNQRSTTFQMFLREDKLSTELQKQETW